jgi:biopolymer transport protein ExbD
MTAAPGIQLRRRPRARAVISLVPMIDVLILLLIFFMVTSTYLNLDFIPAIRADDPEAAAASETSAETLPADVAISARTLLVRLQADGTAVIAGQRLTPEALQSAVAARLQEQPDLPVMILPSGAANTQDLVTLMDRLAAAGAPSVRIVRVEATEDATP